MAYTSYHAYLAMIFVDNPSGKGIIGVKKFVKKKWIGFDTFIQDKNLLEFINNDLCLLKKTKQVVRLFKDAPAFIVQSTIYLECPHKMHSFPKEKIALSWYFFLQKASQLLFLFFLMIFGLIEGNLVCILDLCQSLS